MAEHSDREHYIPIRKNDLINLLADGRDMTPESSEQFSELCKLICATYHHHCHEKLDKLKDLYAAFDPESATVSFKEVSPAEQQEMLHKLFNRFKKLMESANFMQLSHEELHKALEEYSFWGINMEVDFTAFEKMAVFVRGDTIGKRFKRHWIWFWCKEPVEVGIFNRLVLIVKLAKNRGLPAEIDTDDVFIKYFKEIPKADVEMLLPGARLTMPHKQRLKLGGSLLSGLVLITYNVVKQMLTAAALGAVYIYSILFAVVGYSWRQYYGYQSAKTACSLQLTQSLYYQNIANNSAVLCSLMDEAEEQEIRETILAYFYLWRYAGEAGWEEKYLDDFIEEDLAKRANVEIDFEVKDGLKKVLKLGLVENIGDRYIAVPIERAKVILDEQWDNIFQYHQAEASA